MKKQKKIEIPQRAQKDDRFLNDYISAYYDSNFNNKFKNSTEIDTQHIFKVTPFYNEQFTIY